MDQKLIGKLRKEGVDFIVQYADVDLGLPVIAKNKKYIVYVLRF